MFNKPISETAFTCEAAGRLFSNISAVGNPDKSFLVTLRVLLHKRLPQNEFVTVICKEMFYGAGDFGSSSTARNMDRIIPDEVRYPNTSSQKIIIVYSAYQDAGEKMLELIRTNAGIGKKYMSDYTLRTDLQVFYARRLNAMFFTDDKGNTVIFTDKLELKHFHVLQMMLPKYLPALFSDNPLTDTETELLKSLGNKSAVEYERLITELSRCLDIRSEIIRTKLGGFETVFERMRADEIKNEISCHKSNYDNHLSIMRDLTRQIQDCEYTLAGLECAIKERSGDSELMEYFMCNKNLSIMKVTGTAITFVAHGYADMYDQDAFNLYVENLSGYMYNSINQAVSRQQMKKLYMALFGEGTGKYRLRLCAAFTADMRKGLSAQQYYSYPPESRDYFPNPHINHYACVGGYAGRFQEFIRQKDYVGAVEQAAISGRNLNFYDSVVMSTFANDLSHTEIKCIEKADGSLLTPIEVISELENSLEDEQCQDQLS